MALGKSPGTSSLAVPHEELWGIERKFVDTMYKHTCKVMCGCLCAMFLLFVAVAVSGLMQMSDDGEYDWTIADSDTSRNLDALDDALGRADSMTGNPNDGSDPRTDVEWSQAFVVMYSHASGQSDSSLFTPANVQSMCTYENFMLGHPDYKNLCWLDASGKCKPQPKSPMRFFYGNQTLQSWGYGAWDCSLLSDAEVASGATTLHNLLVSGTAQQRLDVGYHVSKTAVEDGYTSAVRTQLVMGAPLAGFRNTDDRWSEQRKTYNKFIVKVEEQFFDHFGMTNTFFSSAYTEEAIVGNMQVRWAAAGVFNEEFSRLVNGDLALSLSAMVFVFGYIWFHTASLWLASTAMAQILLSLPVAFFIYRVFFQISYFTQLHVLVIFLVLGVGADDVFVFVDGWKQSAATCTDELERLRFSYHRASRSVFNTSFTTAFAFAATALSPIMPISSFGIYAAVCIVLNYCFVLILTPCEVLVYHRKWSADAKAKREAEQAAKTASAMTTDGAAVVRVRSPLAPGVEMTSLSATKAQASAAVAKPSDVALSSSRSSESDEQRTMGRATQSQQRLSVSRSDTKLRRSERVFRDYFVPFLLYKYRGYKVVAWAVLAVFTAYFVTSVVWASRLETPRSQEQWFQDNHMFATIFDYQRDTFLSASTDDYVKATVAMGIEGIDRSDFVRWEPEDNRGTAIFNPDFDLSTTAAQDFFLQTCEALRTKQCDLDGCQSGSTPATLVLPGGVSCWMESFRTWYTDKVSSATPVLPTGAAFTTELKEFRSQSPEFVSAIGFIDGALKYATIKVTLSLQMEQPNFVSRPIYEAMEDFTNSRQAAAPASVGRLQQTSEFWTWIRTEQGLVDGMWQGLIICAPVAFLVVCVATNNLVLATFSILCIAGVVCSVLGAGEFYFGWSLGTAESISAVIIIGLSVDFTLHLAHMYADSMRADRESRASHAAVTMGVTVVAGAVTTVGAGVLMLFCQMTFFTKMGTLITLTIVFSIATALLPFLALCAVLGPENEVGKISLMAKRAYAMCRCRRTAA